jgi:hypothetical protein
MLNSLNCEDDDDDDDDDDMHDLIGCIYIP